MLLLQLFRKLENLKHMIKSLTSLRMVFALMVFVSHFEMVNNVFDVHLLTEGFVGVSFFFVLSGFIISYSYDERLSTGKVSKYNFWIARIARIYPLHWMMLLIAAALGTCTLSNGLGYWLRHFIPNLLLCQAYIPEAGYYFSFNSPSWSLCCEQLFYFCFPFMLPLLKKPNRLIGVYIGCAIALVIGMTLTPDSWSNSVWYINPIARFPDFILGMLLYVCFRQSSSKNYSVQCATWIELAAIALFIVFYAASSHVPLVYRHSCYYWIPVAGIIYVFAMQRGFLSRLLSWRPLVWSGEISFGFYLIHHLLIRLYVEAERNFALTLSPYAAVTIIFIATMALSTVSFYFFEQPINKWIKRLLLKKSK